MKKSKIAIITILTAATLSASGVLLAALSSKDITHSIKKELDAYYSKNPAVVFGDDNLYIAIKEVHNEAKLKNCASNKESTECKFVEFRRVNLKKKYNELNDASYSYLKSYYKNKISEEGKFSGYEESAISYFATMALNDNFNNKAYAIVYK